MVRYFYASLLRDSKLINCDRDAVALCGLMCGKQRVYVLCVVIIPNSQIQYILPRRDISNQLTGKAAALLGKNLNFVTKIQ